MAKGTKAERGVVLKRRPRPRAIGENFLRDRRAFIDRKRERIDEAGREADQIRIGHRRRDQSRNRRFLRAFGLLREAQWRQIWLVCLVHGRTMHATGMLVCVQMTARPLSARMGGCLTGCTTGGFAEMSFWMKTIPIRASWSGRLALFAK